MIRCVTKKWGNSIGVILPKKELDELGIQEGQEVVLDIIKKENPLKELFGFDEERRITKKSLLEARRSLESKF